MTSTGPPTSSSSAKPSDTWNRGPEGPRFQCGFRTQRSAPTCRLLGRARLLATRFLTAARLVATRFLTPARLVATRFLTALRAEARFFAALRAGARFLVALRAGARFLVALRAGARFLVALRAGARLTALRAGARLTAFLAGARFDCLLCGGPLFCGLSGRGPSFCGYCHRCTSLGAWSLNRGEACATPGVTAPHRAHCRTGFTVIGAGGRCWDGIIDTTASRISDLNCPSCNVALTHVRRDERRAKSEPTTFVLRVTHGRVAAHVKPPSHFG